MPMGSLHQKFKLLSSVSCLALAPFFVSSALADPSITYEPGPYGGTISSMPDPGVTDWNWTPSEKGSLDVSDGTLRISDGATATGASLNMHYGTTLIVDGSGSLVQADKISGHDIIVSNGGHLAGDSLYDSHTGMDTSGTILIDGAGSTFTTGGGVLMSTFPDQRDMVVVTNGGVMTVGTLNIRNYYESSSPRIVVSGTGSTLTATLGVYRESGGALRVDLYDGGTLNAPVFYGYQGVSVINIGGGYGEPARKGGTFNVDRVRMNDSVLVNFNTLDGVAVHSSFIGDGTLNQIAGETVLTGDNSQFDGIINVSGGALRQDSAGALTTKDAQLLVDGAGTVELDGHSARFGSLTNRGVIEFGGSGGAALEATGLYTGYNGILALNTVLGDDHSVTDLLKTSGGNTGTTKLYINNVGGTGAQTTNGIEVVENLSGDTASDGKFVLLNGYRTKDGNKAIAAGAYAYTLQADNNGNWYLKSNYNTTANQNRLTSSMAMVDPFDADGADNLTSHQATRYSAAVPLYEGYGENMQALNRLPTFSERVGNRYLNKRVDNPAAGTRSQDSSGLWSRMSGGHNRFEPLTSTARMKQDINTLQLQTGLDGQFYEGDSGRLIAGITAQYGHAKGDISSFYGDGDISTDAWSLGATASYLGNQGFYLDAQSQVTWFDNDLDSWSANQGVAKDRKATGYALSLEGGQQIGLGDHWSLTPQAQLSWSSIDADHFHDVWDARVSLQNADSLMGRLGLAVNYATSWKGPDGQQKSGSLFTIANLYQEFLGASTVNVSGVDFDTSNDRTWGGVGIGGSYSWANAKYALYGEGSVDTALNHFADSYALKANVGFKMQW